MKIANEFTVNAPVEQAWEVLTDLERIIPLMPGAAMTGRDGEDVLGKVKVKVGPVTISTDRHGLAPGELAVSKQAVHVGTGTDAVLLGEVTPFGKRQMTAADWARGLRLDGGTRLGEGVGHGDQ